MAKRAGPVTLVDASASGSTRAAPSSLTGFIGRESELAELRELLRSSRLLTLTGGGGTGKTRLATEFVTRFADDFGDGAAWVDLAELRDAGLLSRHVSSALGLIEESGRSTVDALIARLAPLQMLLVLDNCEHLVAPCAELMQTVLAACPGLKALATSREALGIHGETAWLVPPLSVPPTSPYLSGASDIADSEAVQLFVARARAVRPAFVLDDRTAPSVAQVCRRLDGIPLALELAAARVKVLSTEQIADRLDDVFGLLVTQHRAALPRHRTLRGAIDWSYGALDEGERTLFARLAAFRGGWTLDAAERVCSDAELSQSSVLDRISALVDKSLVRFEVSEKEARFSYLEPVRQYALEMLGASDERDRLRDRHAAYFLEKAWTAEPHIRGGARHSEWMNDLEREHGNLRAALEWLGEDDGRIADQLQLDVALLWFHFAMGLFREPRTRITEALARAPELTPRLRGQALTAIAHQSIWLGDYSAVQAPIEDAVALLREADDPDALSLALSGLALVAGLAGDGQAADAYLDEAQAVLGGREGAEVYGFPRLLLYAFSSYWRGAVWQLLGDAPRARAAFEVSVDVARRLGRHPTIAHPLAALGRLLTLEGDLEGAERCLAESLTIHTANDDRWGLTQVMEGGARLALARGDPDRAVRILAAADRLRGLIGATLPPHEAAAHTRLIESIRRQLGEAVFTAAWAAGRAIPMTRMSSEVIGSPHPMDVPQVEPASAAAKAAVARLARSEAAPAANGGTHAATDHDLRVLALGPLEISCRGQLVDGGKWGSAKPRELLLFLLCHPGGATREQIGLALWSESSADRVSNSFHVTLHRLRKALGQPEWIAATGERYRVHPDVRCHFDAGTFERDMSRALKASATEPTNPDGLAEILAAYRGPFLDEEVVGDWHLDVRDRLARLHLEGLLALGGGLAAQNRWSEAADAYRKAVAADDLHEPAYRELMICLARAGDRAQALRLYQRLTTLLADELGTRPEDDTVALYEHLRSALDV